jgi:hypothetical protein
MSTPGFCFKDQKLYAFSEEGVIILHAWPELKALRKEGARAWEEFEPRFRVVKPYRPAKVKKEPQLELAFARIPEKPVPPTLAEQRRKAFNAFRFSLPKPIAAAAEKFQSRQWAILQLMQVSEATIELAGINPALAYALGNFKHFRDKFTTLKGASIIAKRRQRDIAEALGFPGTEATVKILAKILPESVAVDSLRQLRPALRGEGSLKFFSHLPRLNAGVLALATNPALRAASTPTLLAEVAALQAEKYQARAASMLQDMLTMLAVTDPAAGTPRIQSLARLHSLHQEISREYLTLCPNIEDTTKLPRPPLPGTCDIKPILTMDELVREGHLQDNCVATYAEQIRRRSTFIYRVLRPERATLSIRKGDDGDWRISELKARSNTPVSEITRRTVAAWLERFALSV